MRFNGKLEKWNDDRGFGFITPQTGGEPVFVHVSAFPRDGRRPKLGEPLTFEVEPAGDGKKRAVKVLRVGQSRSAQQERTDPRQWTKRNPNARRPWRSVAVGLAAVAIGAYAYIHFVSPNLVGRTPPAATSFIPTTAVPAGGSYRCDGRTHCSQMTSCEEARFFLRNCPGTKMDGDGDGIPCETQWCSR